jgi:hypothetical protein
MRYFCTYFDRNYVTRALALYNSLVTCQEDFHIFMLCMDDEAAAFVQQLGLARATVTPLHELEKASPALLAVKGNRSRIEYYYTCGPSYLLFVMNGNPQVDVLTYLDSDLFFFSSTDPIFRELENSSVGVIEHRFKQESLKRFGTFNVGWISFRSDTNGLACLRWWAERCIEWCYDRIEGDRFADQKYLDHFPRLFDGVHIIQHPGANLAPWNLSRHRIRRHGDAVLVDDQPLIFFHFHGFKMINKWLSDTNTKEYRGKANRVVRENVFGIYIRELKRLQKDALPIGSLMETSRAESRGYGFLRTVARQSALVALGIVRNSYIVDWRALRS